MRDVILSSGTSPESINYYFRTNLTGIVIFTFTGFPRCLPGINLVSLTAFSASSSRPAPSPFITVASTTSPFLLIFAWI